MLYTRTWELSVRNFRNENCCKIIFCCYAFLWQLADKKKFIDYKKLITVWPFVSFLQISYTSVALLTAHHWVNYSLLSENCSLMFEVETNSFFFNEMKLCIAIHIKLPLAPKASCVMGNWKASYFTELLVWGSPNNKDEVEQNIVICLCRCQRQRQRVTYKTLISHDVLRKPSSMIALSLNMFAFTSRQRNSTWLSKSIYSDPEVELISAIVRSAKTAH